MPIKARTAEEVFWNGAIVSPEGCWHWSGSRMSNGRPRAYYNQSYIGASRLSFIVHHGPIPDGLFVLHECDNDQCVNPGHLKAGTQRQNLQDASKRGRIGKKIECNYGHGPQFYKQNGKQKYCRACTKEKRDQKSARGK